MQYKQLYNSYKKLTQARVETTQLSTRENEHDDGIQNIGLCGSEVEGFVKDFLNKHMPKRFRITSGYIANTNDVGEVILSPQIDLIIVDTLVIHNLFDLDEKGDVSVIPIETVLAVFEIKRTLDKGNVDGALEYLEKIQRRLGLDKKNHHYYLPGGVPADELNGACFSNPIIGIVGLNHDEEYRLKLQEQYSSQRVELWETFDKTNVDLVFSLSGFICVTMGRDEKTLKSGMCCYFCRCDKCLPKKKKISELYQFGTDNTSYSTAITSAINFINNWLQKTCGRRIEPADKYIIKNNNVPKEAV